METQLAQGLLRVFLYCQNNATFRETFESCSLSRPRRGRSPEPPRSPREPLLLGVGHSRSPDGLTGQEKEA